MVENKPHDQVIYNGVGKPYLHRWKAIRIYGIFNVYIHKFVDDDEKRALHDHPWPSFSLIVQGTMYEHTKDDMEILVEGDTKYRPAKFTHRLEIEAYSSDDFPITIFITGPKIRAWGFHTEDGWVQWDKFLGIKS